MRGVRVWNGCKSNATAFACRRIRVLPQGRCRRNCCSIVFADLAKIDTTNTPSRRSSVAYSVTAKCYPERASKIGSDFESVSLLPLSQVHLATYRGVMLVARMWLSQSRWHACQLDT